MDSLPSEEKRDCVDVFKLLDKNKNSFIEVCELGTGLRAMGLNPSLSEINQLMLRFDKDSSLGLTFEEFTGVYKECLSVQYKREAELKKQFELLDKNKDGKLNCLELREFLLQGEEGMSEAEIEMVFEEFDKNNDGFIDIPEFLAALIES